MIEITHTMPSYNPRRYGRPWIARITAWPIGGRPGCAFGTTSRDGVTLTVGAEPGEPLYYGQRDNRGNGSVWQFALANVDGTLTNISESEARKHFRKSVDQS